MAQVFLDIEFVTIRPRTDAQKQIAAILSTARDALQGDFVRHDDIATVEALADAAVGWLEQVEEQG
jgi:hypothetical protein